MTPEQLDYLSYYLFNGLDVTAEVSFPKDYVAKYITFTIPKEVVPAVSGELNKRLGSITRDSGIYFIDSSGCFYMVLKDVMRWFDDQRRD